MERNRMKWEKKEKIKFRNLQNEWNRNVEGWKFDEFFFLLRLFLALALFQLYSICDFKTRFVYCWRYIVLNICGDMVLTNSFLLKISFICSKYLSMCMCQHIALSCTSLCMLFFLHSYLFLFQCSSFLFIIPFYILILFLIFPFLLFLFILCFHPLFVKFKRFSCIATIQKISIWVVSSFQVLFTCMSGVYVQFILKSFFLRTSVSNSLLHYCCIQEIPCIFRKTYSTSFL